MMLIVGGCATPRVDLNAAAAADDPKAYEDAFLTWSRDLRVIPFNGMDNVLTARATYLSDAFREAYVTRMAADLEMTSAETATLRSEELARGKIGHEFYITLHTGVKGCDDLDPDEGPWRIRLIDHNGREVAPSSVDEIDEPSAAETEYFQFDPAQRAAYRVMFPKNAQDGAPILTPSTPYFELFFSSALGKNRVRWETTAF